ncbi:MAG TPA: D-aminoacylase [Verrucomicrobiae bacterium]|nr:D-aminoacylase [Verrucomicrobiae bacterium]
MKAPTILSLIARLMILCGTALLPAGTHAQDWDVLIRRARIIDGTGRPSFEGNVAITGTRIARVGQVEGPARREIDATGLVLAPGFIDVHTHAEGILGAPDAENFVRMGVTTIIAGNCGASEPNVAAFLGAVETKKVAINIATLVGHNAVREQVMGSGSARPPTAQELNRMKSLVEQAMREGALGLSTGLIYSPGKYSRTDEIIELAKVAAAYHGIYTTHVRDEQEGLFASLQEAFAVGRGAKIPVEISHLKLSGNLISPQKPETIRYLEKARAEGLVTNVIIALEKARQEGLKISQDLYPYSGATAFLTRLIPPSACEGGRDQLERRLADPNERAKISAAMQQDLLRSGHTNYAHAVIVTARRYKRLQGMTLVEAAQERRGTKSLDAQIDLILEIEGNGGASIILYEMNEPDLIPLMLLRQTMFISDSGTFQFGNETAHPRGYGSAARILARYVREEKLLSLEEAIRRMTSLAASTFQLKDRGEIREGAWADLAIFDPLTVRDEASFASPHVCAVGFKHVFVNGMETVTNDRHTGARAGRAVRRGE